MTFPELQKKKVFLTGHTGQLGRIFHSLLAHSSVLKVYENSDGSRADMRDLDLLRKEIFSFRPDFLINAGAYTAVDKAEVDQESADLVNHRAVGVLGTAAKELGAVLIHFSTDYVFSGDPAHRPWTETDATSPLNHYGLTKRRGEEVLERLEAPFLCFRTSWVYSADGQNFFKTILRLASEREQLTIVSDQKGVPTSADFLATTTLAILERMAASPGLFKNWGIYHLCPRGETSWFEFAEKIVAEARNRGAEFRCKEIHPLLSVDYPTPAKRPLNSKLDCSKFDQTFYIPRESWEEGLSHILSKHFQRVTDES